MVEVDDVAFKAAADEIRDIVNWIAVFETEYQLPKEVVDQLRKRLESLANNLGLGTL